MTTLRPIGEAARMVTLLERIVAAAGATYGVPRAALFSPYDVDDSGRRRKGGRHVSRARHIVMYLATTDLGLSPVVVGDILGGRDRTTVMYGRNVIASMIQHNSIMRQRVDAIRASAGVAQG